MLREVVGLYRRNPHSVIAFDLDDVLYQGLEVSVAIMVASHVDAGKHYLLEAVCRHAPDVVRSRDEPVRV